VKRLLPIVLLAILGCSREELRPPAAAALPVERAIAQIVDLVVPEGRPKVSIREIDADALTAADFRTELEAFSADTLTLWMPGRSRWLLIGWNGTNRVSLARAMEAVAVDAENTAALPDVFASYCGTREEILPAFEAKLEGRLLPEWFVSREIPALAWLSVEGVDADILKRVLADIRSAQVVRRLVLEGNIAAQAATDRKGEEAAEEKWARAMARNPRDPMLLERLQRLERNAKGFLAAGKVVQAMKCYETIVIVNPKDAAAVHNFGVCLKRIGKIDLAQKVLKRAEELAK